MRVLAHIHTFNDEDVIDRALAAVLSQTRAVDGVLIVDDGSSDQTLDREFPDNVSIIRHSENRGTAGTIHSGMTFALENGYDWIWIFDGDSAPRRDALEKLLDFFEQLSEQERTRILRLSSYAFDEATKQWHPGLAFTRHGYKRAWPGESGRPYPCPVAITSGSLFRLEAVRQFRRPRLDYVIDWVELDYGFNAMKSGYASYVVPSSVIDHNTRGEESFQDVSKSFGPLELKILEVPPLRCYYYVRNWVYFWIYVFRPLSIRAILRQLAKISLWSLKFLVWPFGRRAQIAACLRGFWHGLRKNMAYRY